MGVNPGVSIVFEPLIVTSSLDARKLAPMARALAGLEGEIAWELEGPDAASFVFVLGPKTLRVRHGTSDRPLGRIRCSVPAFFALVTHDASPLELLEKGELELHGPADGLQLVQGFVDHLDTLRAAAGSGGRVTNAWLDFALRASRTGHSFRKHARTGRR